MQGSRHARRWSLVAAPVVVLALVVGTVVRSPAAGAPGDVPVTGGAAPIAASANAHYRAQTLGVPNADILPSVARRGAAQAPLIDSLRAAQVLADAGLLPPPDHPPLAEILQAVAALAKASALPPRDPQPSLSEVLSAARVLAAAGVLPPAPHAGLPPQAPPPSETAVPPPPVAPGWYDDAYSQRIRDLVNQERTRAGLAPVAVEPRLASASGAYAKVLADYHWFAHVGPDGSTFVSRIVAAGFPFNVEFGEILAWGTRSWSAESMVQMWMNSPSHREEILSPVYTRAGVRCYFTAADGVTVYCVMDFAG